MTPTSTEHDADQAKSLWPLLLDALEGEGAEDWDGDRQRTLLVRPGGEKYLARQLSNLRNELIEVGSATADDLPEPHGGFAAHLR